MDLAETAGIFLWKRRKLFLSTTRGFVSFFLYIYIIWYACRYVICRYRFLSWLSARAHISGTKTSNFYVKPKLSEQGFYHIKDLFILHKLMINRDGKYSVSISISINRKIRFWLHNFLKFLPINTVNCELLTYSNIYI